MEKDLNFFEIQVIQQNLAIKSVSFIAMVINRSETLVLSKIKQLTSVSGQLPFDDIKRNNKLKERTKAINDNIFTEMVRRSKKSVRTKPATKSELRKYQNKVIDYSTMILVRIDAKTHIQIPAGSNIEKAKLQFLQNHRSFSVMPESSWKKVSKFK